MGGDTVTVRGTGFTGVTKVAFGASAGRSVNVLSDKQLTVVAPAHPSGTVDLRITGPYGTSAITKRGQYTYRATPSIIAVAPASGPDTGGTSVTVTGTAFTDVEEVSFGGVAGTSVKLLTSNQLTVIAPRHSAGTVDVRVSGGSGTSPIVTQDRYTYEDSTPPSPVSGAVAGDITSSSIALSWTNPGSPNYTGVTIRRALGTTPPGTPTSGTAVADLAAPADNYTDTNLLASTTYSYALFAHNATGISAMAATITVTTSATPQCTPKAVHVAGVVAEDTTWEPECAIAYVIDGPLTVASGVTLTVAPGTIVKAQDTLYVEGDLVVQGTTSSPVVFTSWLDDSVAGDTNNDGSATSPAPGNWGGIQVVHYDNQQSPPPSVRIDHARISYGYFNLETQGAKGVSLTNSTITSSARNGVAIYRNVDAPVVRNNTFLRNGMPNSAVGLQDGALWVNGDHLDLDLVSENSGSGNGYNGTWVSGIVDTSSAMTSGSDWPIGPGLGDCTVYGGCNNGGSGPLTVASGVTLTVAPGTIVKAQDTLYVEGDLVVQGTTSSPVVFTSWLDDSVAGDTNNDGSATSPAPGNWGGIKILDAEGGTQIDAAIFRYAASAIDIGLLSRLTVNTSEFAYNQSAFTVASTTDSDPELSALPCVPPYTSFVRGEDVWFGADGKPGSQIDISGFLGLTVPAEFGPFYGELSQALSHSSYLGDNSIPWAMYSCTDAVEFPVTPVLVSLADTAPFPDLKEQNTSRP